MSAVIITAADDNSSIVQEETKDIMTPNAVDSTILGGPNLFEDRLLKLLFENKDEFLAEAPLSSTSNHQSSHHRRSRRTRDRKFAIERSLFDTALQSICEEDENCSQESKKDQQPNKQPQPKPQQHLVPVVYSY